MSLVLNVLTIKDILYIIQKERFYNKQKEDICEKLYYFQSRCPKLVDKDYRHIYSQSLEEEELLFEWNRVQHKIVVHQHQKQIKRCFSFGMMFFNH